MTNLTQQILAKITNAIISLAPIYIVPKDMDYEDWNHAAHSFVTKDYVEETLKHSKMLYCENIVIFLNEIGLDELTNILGDDHSEKLVNYIQSMQDAHSDILRDFIASKVEYFVTIIDGCGASIGDTSTLRINDIDTMCGLFGTTPSDLTNANTRRGLSHDAPEMVSIHRTATCDIIQYFDGDGEATLVLCPLNSVTLTDLDFIQDV